MTACRKKTGMPELPPGMTRKAWTAQVERKVKRLREADWTSSEIAAELGIHRDSVARIAKRLQEREEVDTRPTCTRQPCEARAVDGELCAAHLADEVLP